MRGMLIPRTLNTIIHRFSNHQYGISQHDHHDKTAKGFSGPKFERPIFDKFLHKFIIGFLLLVGQRVVSLPKIYQQTPSLLGFDCRFPGHIFEIHSRNLRNPRWKLTTEIPELAIGLPAKRTASKIRGSRHCQNTRLSASSAACLTINLGFLNLSLMMSKPASLEKLQFDGLCRPQYVVLQGRKLIISTTSLDLARQTLAHAKSGLAMKGLVTEHVDHAAIRPQA